MTQKKSKASAKKIAANRANALKSTGPRTAQGKDVSRRNSLVHGLTAEVLLLDHEDPGEFQLLRDALYEDYPPVDAIDVENVDRLVMTLWRMRRIPVFERSIIAWMMHYQQVEHDGPVGEVLVPRDAEASPRGLKGTTGDSLQQLRAGRALEALLEKNVLGKLDAHQARLSREFKYLVDTLEAEKFARIDLDLRQKAAAVKAQSVSPPRILPPAEIPEASARVAGTVASPARPAAIAWQAASARGSYVSPTEREARKLEGQANGTSTAG